MIDDNLLFLAKIADGDDSGLWRLLGVSPSEVAERYKAAGVPVPLWASIGSRDAGMALDAPTEAGTATDLSVG